MATVQTVKVVSDSEAQVRRGFKGVTCPLCGHEDCVTVTLHDVEAFQCAECDGEFAVEDVQAFIDAWTKVLAWCAAAPVLED